MLSDLVSAKQDLNLFDISNKLDRVQNCKVASMVNTDCHSCERCVQSDRYDLNQNAVVSGLAE